MKPVVVLVGRPNVGKSTLFNKLTRTRDALVADLPGVTRDRLYGDGRMGDMACIVVDTGGLSGEEVEMDRLMEGQTRQALDEADVIVFMLDGRAGLTPQDSEIANELRRRKVPIVVAVNKVDGVGDEQAQLEFFELGLGDPVSIAAVHNRGIANLADRITDELGLHESEVETDNGGHQCRVAFIGRPNVGKSTLINHLLGDERVIALDKPGTTRDAISIPFSRKGRDYVLIDTAGIRRRGKVRETVEKFSVVKTLKAIDDCNVCVYMIDAVEGISEQDLHLLGYVVDKGRALVVAVNKWDGLSADSRADVKSELERRITFLKMCNFHFISALRGTGINSLFKSVNDAWRSAFIDLATPELTRMLEYAVSQHQPPLVNGRRIKLRYAHQGGVNPPVIVIHGNQTNKVPANYRRYLNGFFQRELRLSGTPLVIEFRSGANPFADKRPKPGGTKRGKGSRAGSKADNKRNRKPRQS